MMIDKVNAILNGNLAKKLKELSLESLENILSDSIKTEECPEIYLDNPEAIYGMILHCELVIARELKNRYDKISEGN